VLLAPTAIEEVVRDISELGDEYEVTVTKKGDIDDITLKVEIAPDFKGDVGAVEQKLIQQLRLKTGLRYNLEFHDYGTLPRYAVKAKRFKDLRHKEQAGG
jgi:phenylacetate-CoA ligase